MTAAPAPCEGWPSSLDARFLAHRRLGRGRFGTVFEATDVQRGARVAVKVLDVDRPEALQAFKREFRALAELAHDNLVALHELGREGATWFLVMELLDGDDLLAGLARAPHLALPAFAQVALGLGFLHAAGRVHRDLKPANVRLTSTGRAVVLDFGLTVVAEASPAAPALDEGLVGSAAYLAPEQAAGGEASPASDLYALGVMLCEALTGRRPFTGSGLEVLAAKRAGRPTLAWPETVAQPVRALVERLLEREPAARPQVAEVVRALDPTRAHLLELRPDVPLLGRDEALAMLEAAARGEGQAAVWISAPPGVGKSALLRRFLGARERDTAVFASTCFEHETTPFRALDGVVDGLARWLARRATLPEELRLHGANLARSFPVLRHLECLAGVAPSASLLEAHRHEAALALKALLAFVAQAQRVVVAIDDLHWADADSLPLLRELLEGTPPAPLCFLGAMRDEGRAVEALRAARRLSHSAELRLEPLDAESSRALVRAVAPEAAQDDGVLAAARGNPFLLQTLAGHAGGLGPAVEARVARVPQGARRLLEAVCLAGAPLPRAAWARAGSLDLDEALALGHLRAGRLVRVRTDGALEPYHDTLAHAVVDGLSAEARRARHGGLADALEAVRAEPELLAEHLAGAGKLLWAAEQAVVAAERAAQALAFHHAATLYGRALAWAPRHAQARARQVALGRALANAGRGEEAAQAFLAARDLWAAEQADEGAPTALELEQWAAAQLLRTGRIDRGLALTRQVLAAHGLALAESPRGALASLVWTRLRLQLRGWRSTRRAAHEVDPRALSRIDVLTSSSIGLAAVDSLRAADLMGRALLEALDAGEPRRLAVCLGFETAFSGNGGGAAEARTRRVQALGLSLAEALGDDYALACTLGGAGIAAFHLGRLTEALASLDRAAGLFLGCVGAVKELFTLQLFALAALAQRGDLGELRARLPEHLRLATERGDRYAEANIRSGLPNLAWLGADDEARARQELELAKPGLQTTGYSVQHFFELLGRFQVELYAGDGAAANEVLAAGLPALERSLLRRTEWIAIATEWMKGRAALSHPDARHRSRRRADALAAAKRIERRRRPWGDALAMSLRAGAAALGGSPREALQCLETTEHLADAAELRLHALTASLLRLQRTGGDDAEVRAKARGLGGVDLAKLSRVYLPGASQA